jgi:DNA-binding transcriptional MocR family regulator
MREAGSRARAWTAGPSVQPKEALLLPPPPTPWTSRVWQEFRAGNLTRAARDVLLTLKTYRGHGGLICPAHATLADRANCHASTVLRALQAARDLGLVSWTERRVRAAWRSLRTSNRYRLIVPEAPVTPGQRTNQQSAGGGESQFKKEAREGSKAALAAMLATAERLPDLLKARREVMEARWRGAIAAAAGKAR